jgi:hypothetical protein
MHYAVALPKATAKNSGGRSKRGGARDLEAHPVAHLLDHVAA